MPQAGLPKHVGIIMDGNGRWANQRGWRRMKGHFEGAEKVIDVIEEAIALKLTALSLFCFSTENWKRSEEEINFLMELMLKFIDKQFHRLHKDKVKVRVLGEIHKAPLELQKGLVRAVELTKDNEGLALNFLVSYGGRHDLLQATREIAARVAAGELKAEEISEETIRDSLFTKGLPDPDLIIRTSGEFRISNFMLWQSAYAEFFVSPKFWPDFTREDLREACLLYASRDRRFGASKDLPEIEKVEAKNSLEKPKELNIV